MTVAIEKVTKVKYNGLTRIANICITPNGTRITSIGGFYFKVSNDNTVNNKRWYIGNEHENNKHFELWQYEKMVNGSYKIVTTKKLIA